MKVAEGLRKLAFAMLFFQARMREAKPSREVRSQVELLVHGARSREKGERGGRREGGGRREEGRGGAASVPARWAAA